MNCPVLLTAEEVVMKRTLLLQELRKMRFEHAYGGWTEGRLSRHEATQ